MKTREEREAAFRKDLNSLLAKHDAELEPCSQWGGEITITMMGKWDENQMIQISEFTEFYL